MSEVSPALMVDQATPETAAEIADQLVAMLADPRMPEPMRRDLRSRLTSLYRRFPDLDADE